MGSEMCIRDSYPSEMVLGSYPLPSATLVGPWMDGASTATSTGPISGVVHRGCRSSPLLTASSGLPIPARLPALLQCRVRAVFRRPRPLWSVLGCSGDVTASSTGPLLGAVCPGSWGLPRVGASSGPLLSACLPELLRCRVGAALRRPRPLWYVRPWIRRPTSRAATSTSPLLGAAPRGSWSFPPMSASSGPLVWAHLLAPIPCRVGAVSAAPSTLVAP